MSQRRAGHVNRCPNCRVNHFFCVCKHILPFNIQTNISLIVHVRELKLTSNTAQFAQKMLPENAEVVIRGRMNEHFDSTPVLSKPGRAIFLYPHEDALELNEDFKVKYPGPYHLIVPDGNWQQARKVKQRESGFNSLPAVKLPPGIISEYGLRKAIHPEWVSTYEAMAHSLGILESVEIKNRLMDFFRIWVKRTEQARSGDFKITD
jgi:DTW domain-containing protein YfiP